MERLRTIVITFLTLILSGIGIASEYSSRSGFALEIPQTVYEQQNIMDDLKGSTINGRYFDISEYPYNENGEPQLISFIEYCYSSTVEKQGDFGLYIYVYNPARTAFNLNSENNCIQLRTGGDQSASFSNNYKLKYLNSGNDGLFLKFKINLTSVQKQGILSRVQSNERVYEVSGFELMCDKDITEYPVGMTFRYSGYAEGYAPDASQDGTLKCEVEGGLLTLSLEAYPTAYRPDGSNGKNVFTQDSLHSVYFAIPNKIIETYGEMSQIHAKWLSATLKPGLVTGNKEMYEKLLPIVAHQIPFSSISKYESYGVDWKYAYLGAVKKIDFVPGLGVKTHYGYGIWGNCSDDSLYHTDDIYGEDLDELPILLYAANGNADRSKFESTKELHDYIKKYPYVCPVAIDPLSSLIVSNADPMSVAGKYPSSLFSKFDTEYTEVLVKPDENIELKKYKVDKTWWGKLLGSGFGWEQEEQPFKNIQAIQSVKESDFLGSEYEISERLAIGKADLPEFRDFYEKNKTDSTIFLFRYYVGDFMAQEATRFYYKKVLGGHAMEKVDTNAYFFQTDVNLNFDIIDISYDNGTTVTTIPVIMSPIDVIPNPTPPLITTSDDSEFWRYGVGIMAALVGVGIVVKIIDKGARKV